mmetsp:Transcript_39832/g.94467  ORF Transcript_39832/g.94467 Transcript_39832/m.94467 type:complete len:220 (-) Transcript_39832:1447-2106(-)
MRRMSMTSPSSRPSTVALPIPGGPWIEMAWQAPLPPCTIQSSTNCSSARRALLISMSRPRMLFESRTGASFLVILRSVSTGRNTLTLVLRPLTFIEHIFSNTADPDDALRVSSSTRMQQLAFCINRAARITADPTAVYSRRVSLPTSPQIVVPVAMPTHDWMLGVRALRFLRISIAQCTARTGSSSWAMSGKPNTILRTVPLSSIWKRETVPSYLCSRP